MGVSEQEIYFSYFKNILLEINVLYILEHNRLFSRSSYSPLLKGQHASRTPGEWANTQTPTVKCDGQNTDIPMQDKAEPVRAVTFIGFNGKVFNLVMKMWLDYNLW